jgi:MFS family permease
MGTVAVLDAFHGSQMSHEHLVCRIVTGYRDLARNRDFTVLWVGETLSELGSAMSKFVFPLLAYHLTGSAVQAAFVPAAYYVALCLTLLPAGVLADRMNRRHLMLASKAAGATLYASLIVAGLVGDIDLAQLIVVAFGTGLTAGVFGPAQSSAIRSVVAADQLPTALSQNQARSHVAAMLGGPLGGLLYVASRWLPFAADAASYAVSYAAITSIRTDLSPRCSSRDGMRSQLAGGLQFIWARPFFRVMLTWAALANLLGNAVFFVILLRLVQADYHPAQIGFVETAAGVGGILGAVAAPAIIQRIRTGWLTIGVAWTIAVPLLPLVWRSTPLTACLCIFALMLLNPAGNAGIGAYRAAITPAELQGRVASASQFLAMSMMPLAPLLGGVLLHRLGGGPAILVLILGAGLLALFLTCCSSIREVPRPEEWGAESPAVAAR